MCQKILLVVAALVFGCSAGVLGVETEQWDIFELTLKGPSDGNPFADVRFSAEFRRKDEVFKPEGFYDGNGIYKVRFLPDAVGKWTYVTRSNRKDLDGKNVATGIGSSHHRILEEVMRQEGIKFNIVNQAPEVAVGNLEAGKLEGFCYWPPYIELMKYKGIGQLVPPGNTKKYEPYVNAIWPIVVSKNMVKKNPGVVKAFVKADQDLHKFMQEHPDEAAQIVFKATEGKLPIEVLKGSLASYNYASKIGKEHIEVMQRDIDFLNSKGFLKKHFKASDWVDTSFSN